MPHSILNTLTIFPGTLANYQEEITEVFSRAVPNKVFSVYLFGSRARGQEENGSDADLAISGEQINRADLSLIREQWEYSTIPVMLDLVDTKDIGSALSAQIEKEKVLLLDIQPKKEQTQRALTSLEELVSKYSENQSDVICGIP